MTKWLSLYIGGQLWPVYLVSPRSKHLEKTHLAGYCDVDRCRIFISKALDEQAREDTLLHELLHALLYVTGSFNIFNGDEAAEENFVLALTPVLHRLIKDLGFRFPKGPDKAAA